MSIFAGAGVLLVALGVYGVLAYTVSQQTREIAIRPALGGDRGHVVRMLLKLGLQMVAVGLVTGVALSIATNRLLQSELWGTTPTDPMTFAAGALVTLAIGHRVPRACAPRGAGGTNGRPAARVIARKHRLSWRSGSGVARPITTTVRKRTIAAVIFV